MSGVRHRRIGNVCEREVVDCHRDLSVHVERYPLNGASRFRNSGQAPVRTGEAMSTQLDMFPTEVGTEPNTNSDLVGLAVRRQFRARHKGRSKPTACRHEPNVVRGAGEITMTEFAIVVTELSGNKTELCRVRS